MKRKIWFYLCIIQAIVILLYLWSSLAPVQVKKVNLQNSLEQKEKYGYFPETGYIPDAKTAKIVGSRIIDNLSGYSKFHISGVDIEYDEEKRLWKVIKGYFI